MEFFKEYWWCFVVFAVIVALAIVGLCIGYKDSKKAKEIVDAESKKEEMQKEQPEQKQQDDDKNDKNEQKIDKVEDDVKNNDKKEE